MSEHNVGLLAGTWRTEADRLRKYGAEQSALALEACAADLEAAELEYLLETLTLEQAADFVGVSYDTMSRRIRRGEVPNAGRKGKPLVRRRAILPGFASVGPRAVTDRGEPDIAAEALNARA